MFHLQPVPPSPQPQPPSALPAPPPKEDLLVTGLCDLFSARSASFRIVEAGHPPTSFTLAEGERNDWLEVLSVNTPNQTVQVRLKKPVVRVRSVGVEVVLKLQPLHPNI
jgi:hypothetical protein